MSIYIKKLLRERLLDKQSKKDKVIINNFVDFVKNYLNISDTKIILTYDRSQLNTTAAYRDNKVIVYVKDRALIDILRSIAHELTHLKQDVEGRLKPEDHEKNNADGSPIENEANSTAGLLIRKYGKLHPNIYD